MPTLPVFDQRILGGLYGSLVGDALGVPVEFSSREARKRDPVIGMRSHGIHNQPAGTWSDDGSLLLCSAENLVEKGFDLQDMSERFLQWFDFDQPAKHRLPCISTGVYCFPPDQATQIAIDATRAFLREPSSIQRVIFCCFSKTDADRYQALLRPST